MPYEGSEHEFMQQKVNKEDLSQQFITQQTKH